ncbi:MAG: hypothetical protein JSS72_07645 [Armatimonadetes bacterium]|nr:hypothetical protein [Armatimonadota bacterium]
MKVKFWQLALGAVVAFYGFEFLRLNVFGPSDETLIKRAIHTAEQASHDGEPGGVLEILSKNFKVNDVNPGSKPQIMNFIRNSHPDIHVGDGQLTVSDEEARYVAPVSLKIDFMGFNIDRTVPDINLIFEKETEHAFIFLPVKSWKLREVILPKELGVESFLPGGS